MALFYFRPPCSIKMNSTRTYRQINSFCILESKKKIIFVQPKATINLNTKNKTNTIYIHVMKKIAVILMLICFAYTVQAQNQYEKGAIGITFSGLGSNDAFHWEELVGAGSFDGKGFNTLGMNYIRPLNSIFDLETGITYSRMKYRVSNSSLGPEDKPYNTTSGLVSIPATVRINFFRYFFFNTGILLDFDASPKDSTVESQTGLGATIGFGAKYDLKNIPIGFFVNPYFTHHAILPFSMGRYPLRTSDTGFRFGLTYRL